MQMKSSGIKIGLDATIITPRTGVLMYGFARSQVSTGVHDELYVKSMVIEDGEGIMGAMLVVPLFYLGRQHLSSITHFA